MIHEEKKPADTSIRPPIKTGDALIASGVITKQQLHIALNQQAILAEVEGGRQFLGRILVNNAFAAEADVLNAVKSSGGVLDLDSLLSHDTCVRLQILPEKLVNGVLHIFAGHAISDSDKEILLAEAAPRAVLTAIKVTAKNRTVITSELNSKKRQRGNNFMSYVDELRIDPENGVALYSMLREMFYDAIDHRASDIHVDRHSDPDKSWISYRVDGSMVYKYLLPQRIMAALLMRIKTDSGMDPSNNRVPQDGRLSFAYEERTIDIRVATQPMDGGETVTLRMLDPKSLKSIKDLFVYQADIVKSLTRLMGLTVKTGGIVLISGSTGQGKSTTLYALLKSIRRDAVNVISVENPVEFRIPFVRQVQLNDFLAEKMSDVLRSLLRQDPDILVVGETRDKDSAVALMNFAESGHTVLTTLHAIDAIQTFERFVTMIGEEKKQDAYFILGNYLKCIVNQKLVRTLCSCAIPVDDDYLEEHRESYLRINAQNDRTGPGAKKRISDGPDVLTNLFADIDAHIAQSEPAVLTNTSNYLRPVGCPRCMHSGYYGRTIVPESLFFPDDEEVRANIVAALIEKKVSIREITRMDGVRFYSRRQAISDLLHAGKIDISAAVSGL